MNSSLNIVLQVVWQLLHLKWLDFSSIVLCCGENQGMQTFPFCTHLLQITRKLTNGNHL